ncbi:MAG TPA: hypothetical protein VK137_17140 [Planctomycetaceae bacterium]|nr:hypothetical protein [Planctomycetaceae bacterium]
MQELSSHGFACATFEWHVVRQDDGGAAVHLEQRFDVLDEVELFVTGGRPEVVAYDS